MSCHSSSLQECHFIIYHMQPQGGYGLWLATRNIFDFLQNKDYLLD